MPDLDIVVPVFNGKETVSRLVSRIHKSLTQKGLSYRVIFIDDFSTDGTQKEIKKLAQKYPVIYHLKNGPKGNAYSVFQAAIYLESEYVVMIDADLRYPPEAIPNMLELAKRGNTGVVVGRRCYEDTSLLGSLVLKVNRLITGKLVTGLSCDTQSGLKLFRREILDHLDKDYVYSGTIDLALLHTCRELGYHVESLDVVFKNKKAGVSKIKAVGTTTIQTLGEALNFRLSSKKVYNLPAEGEKMLGAGLAYKRERFITHTTLDQKISAVITFTRWQKALIITTFLSLVIGLLLSAKITAIVFIAILSAIYFADVFFNLFLVFKSLHFPPELSFSDEDLATIDESTLPVYSILCPLYHEAVVLPQFVSSINALDWPKEKLDVLLLLEEDDEKTVEVARSMNLPSYFRIVIVPDSQPKTKPKACNYGLSFAKGEYIVVYDVEDVPDPNQLKKAYLGFDRLGDKVSCLQAKLNYYNPHQNILTRLFTAEYSLWFDVMLPALQTINTTIPLGGTSNHFRTKDLVKFQGWDPFNVTEDADLGVRIFKSGGKTAIIDSTTLEEANSKLKNWIRQRSRWLKGYMQTYLVHTREPIEFIKTHKYHYLVFQLVSGLRVAFMIINPFLWVMTLSYFLLYRFVGPTIESLYPAPVFYMAVTSAVFGNFLYLYYYMVGAAKRGQYSIIKYIFLIPIYWFFTSIAAFVAFYQLLFKPYFWEKTHHGLNVQANNIEKVIYEVIPQPIYARTTFVEKVKGLKGLSKTEFASGGFLLLATLFSQFLGFLYNTYLGRKVSFEEFGLFSLIGSFVSISQIPLVALSRTITHRSAFILGKYGFPLRAFWINARKKTIKVSVLLAIVWIIFSPFLSHIFKSGSLLPFFLFTPIWVIGVAKAIDSGYLRGSLSFVVLGIIAIIEAVSKLIITVFLVSIGLSDWAYSAIPISMFIALYLGYLVAKKVGKESTEISIDVVNYFPKGFFATSLLVKLSTIAFLNLDVLMAKIYLNPIDAGKYAIISLVGTIVYSAGTLFSQFIIPVVSRDEGAGRSSQKTFYQFLLGGICFGLIAFLGVGLLGNLTVPILLGLRSEAITSFLPIYSLAMVLQSVAASFLVYNQTMRKNLFPVTGFIIAVLQITAFLIFHKDLNEFVNIVFVLSLLNVLLMVLFHAFYPYIVVIWQNFKDFLGLFGRVPVGQKNLTKFRILVFNWRDTKHRWAGGAEAYAHELAKRWVSQGHKVTLFCGNDGKNSRFEVIDGVEILRRGGYYTVYLWAFFYYIFRFRGKFDCVIDNENGVPFFTPLYVRIPKFLLIHHVHQEIFMENLSLPFALFASFLEGRLMPFVYRNTKKITVSKSSKEAMVKLGLGTEDEIEIVHPGVEPTKFKPLKKTVNPTILYLGRLKPYKSIDTLIKAFDLIVKKYSNARLKIAGFGESRKSLERLVTELNLTGFVEFLGKVSEEEKVNLLATSWTLVYPSTMEGWGITAIEANASGTPVIASNVAGLRDSVRNPESGLLVKPRDINGFAQTMDLIISDWKLRKRLELGALEWSRNFTWKSSSKSFMRVIKKNLNGYN